MFYSLTLGITLYIFKITLIQRFSKSMTINEIFKLNDVKEGFVRVLKNKKY
jgi:hypothetical protein